MIDALAQWVRTLAAGAIFCAAALLLVPEGSGKRAVKLVCAAVLTILLVRPLRQLDADRLAELLTVQKLESAAFTADAEELSEELLGSIIRKETEEYIWDAARRLGVAELGIRLRLRTVEGLPCPWSIDLTGTVTDAQKEELSLLLEGDLGIPRQRQTWSVDDAG